MNRHSIIVITVITCFVTSIAVLPDVQGSSLSEAIQKGIANSPAVAEAIAEASVSFAEIREVRSTRLPQVSFDSTGGAAFRDRSIDGIATGTGDTLLSRDARLTIQQILVDFGASKALVESADLRNQFHSLLVDDVKEEQARVIAETYLQLYLLRLQSDAVRKYISDMAGYRDKAEAGENAAGQTPSIIIQGRLINTKSKLAEFHARIEALSGRFRILTTLEPGSMSLNRVPRSLKSSVNIYESPRVRAADLAIQSSEKNIDAAKRDMLPKLYLEGRGGLGENVVGIEGSDNEWAALAVFRWTPYLGGRKQAVLDVQRGELERDLAAKERVIQSIRDAVSVAQAELNGAVERQRQSGEGKNELNTALGRYSESLDAGADGVSVLSLVSTRQEVLTAELEAHSALVDSYMASIRGLSAAGGLLKYFGIGNEK